MHWVCSLQCSVCMCVAYMKEIGPVSIITAGGATDCQRLCSPEVLWSPLSGQEGADRCAT